ncbi:uncharacterized protein LOC113279166 [Papaver somniferum]|uniref:uncharacterized protein LOC113279166 n=1 Tax=Papaver somniferum TaxID=3469 RepID=UPI000E6F65A5|nr:uncharacterized protein LOC113279166 [Papaver somniferum]
MVWEGGLRITYNKWDQNYDQDITLFFKLGTRSIKFQDIKVCHWQAPSFGVTLFCCDGASFGNPGLAGFGVVVRDHLCQVICTLTGGLGITTNYIAEVFVVTCAAELVVEWKLGSIIISSDSQKVINEFTSSKIPWFIKMRWRRAASQLMSIRFCHCYRETNFSADVVAKNGAQLRAGERQLYMGRPPLLTRIELAGINYYRFS